jgi:hypothetical protein
MLSSYHRSDGPVFLYITSYRSRKDMDLIAYCYWSCCPSGERNPSTQNRLELMLDSWAQISISTWTIMGISRTASTWSSGCASIQIRRQLDSQIHIGSQINIVFARHPSGICADKPYLAIRSTLPSRCITLLDRHDISSFPILLLRLADRSGSWQGASVKVFSQILRLMRRCVD